MAQRTPPVTNLFEALEPRLMLSATVSFLDAAGGEAVAKLSGNGEIIVLDDEAGVRLRLIGTDRGSSLTINGDGRVLLDGIETTGAMKAINGKDTDLTGDVTIAGTVDKLTLGDFIAGTQKTITIGGTNAASDVTLKVGRLVDVDIVSGSPIKSLSVEDWDDTATDDSITAPLLSKASSKADFAAGARLADEANAKELLSSLSVKGELSGTWHVDNGAGKISAGSVSDTFSMNIIGAIKSLSTKGDFEGDMAATSIDKLQVNGSVRNAHILAGADMGADGILGGGGANTDLFFQGEMKKASVKGGVFNSVIAVGLDPIDGVFADGDDVVTGKHRSEMGSLSIQGQADSLSLLAAGQFKKTVKVNGTKILPAGDPRFLLASSAPDNTAPVITAVLINVSSTIGGIPVTNDPIITGRVTDLGRITKFRVGIDDDELKDFENILKQINANGTFELPRSMIEGVNDGPLTLGEHTVNFVAEDDEGNTTAVFPVRFILTA